jgi:hypothetical protein
VSTPSGEDQTPTDENLVGTDGAGTFTEMEVDSAAIYETALTLPDVIENFSLGSDEPPRFIPLEPVDLTNSDGDLLPDQQDNCPGVSNDGQADADDNGVGDACDTSTDTDGDSIEDSLDNCPEVVNEDQEDFDSDGVGDMCTEVS